MSKINGPGAVNASIMSFGSTGGPKHVMVRLTQIATRYHTFGISSGGINFSIFNENEMSNPRTLGLSSIMLPITGML